MPKIGRLSLSKILYQPIDIKANAPSSVLASGLSVMSSTLVASAYDGLGREDRIHVALAKECAFAL